MKEYFQKLFSYDTWANDEIIDCLMKNKVQDTEVTDILSHIYNAQLIWYSRITNQPTEVKTWDRQDIEKIKPMFHEIAGKYFQFLEKLDEGEINKLVAYSNSQGDNFINKLSDILTHVTHHGVYHRGQLAKLIRKAGYTPPATDYIYYFRKQ